MKATRMAILAAALSVGSSIADADSLYEFDFEAAGLSATGTLDVSAGQAISGSGSISASGLTPSPEPLTLVTLATAGVHDLGGGNLSYRFGGGTDLIGDTVFNSTAPYVSSSGLVFMVGGPDDNGFNLGYQNGQVYYSYLVGNTLYQGDTGTLTVTPVPLPAAAWLMLGGLGGLGAVRFRRR